MLLYYITDRTHFSGTEPERRKRLLEKIGEAARSGIDYVQLRERDLPGRELESLARAAVRAIRANGEQTRLLINSRMDVSISVGADGVHLRAKDVSPQDARKIWRQAHESKDPIIAVSCHTPEDVTAAGNAGADFVVFGPVFGKKGAKQTAGADLLRSVCPSRIPVLALGGVTLENARACIDVGASGIAGIRLFQENQISALVEQLRNVATRL